MGVPLVKLKPLIGQKQIADKIQEISLEIDCEYAGKDLVILMVLKDFDYKECYLGLPGIFIYEGNS